MVNGAGMPRTAPFQNGGTMTDIFSLTGFSGNASPAKSGASKNSARQQILNQIAASDPHKAQQLEEKLSSLQQTIQQMQKMRQDMNAARKDAARQKLARIKAEMQALKFMGGDAKANARKLARLARELAAAARDYKSAGGSDMASMASAGVSAPAAAEKTEEATAAMDGLETAQATDEETDDAPTDAAKIAASEDEDFAHELRKLRRQIQMMVEKEKMRMALEKGKAGNVDIRAADATLRDVERHAASIENTPISVDIHI